MGTNGGLGRPVLALNDVSVTFKRPGRGSIRAVDGVTLNISEGDLFGLLGPNGAGKSTAMYCMLGLLQPESGTVRMLEQQVFPGAGFFEDVVYLPEEPHYHDYLSVQEAVTFYASLYRRRIPESRVVAALRKVGLADFRRLRIAKCSKGMKQKVGLAACMLFEPRVMLLDEPTRGLDPIMVRIFRDYLLARHEKGTTIILNSHVLSEVELVCRRIGIMKGGKIIADDELHNLVRVDADLYEVVLEAAGDLPAFVRNVSTSDNVSRGQVSERDLEALMRYCREQHVKLRSCHARVETLEDVFMRLLGA